MRETENKQEVFAQEVTKSAEQQEKGYVINKGMPRFVGDTEIKRLRKVVDEKNALIEKFKKYDEERKAYYAELMDEYNEMKSSFTQFTDEQKKFIGNAVEVNMSRVLCEALAEKLSDYKKMVV